MTPESKIWKCTKTTKSDDYVDDDDNNSKNKPQKLIKWTNPDNEILSIDRNITHFEKNTFKENTGNWIKNDFR